MVCVYLCNVVLRLIQQSQLVTTFTKEAAKSENEATFCSLQVEISFLSDFRFLPGQAFVSALGDDGTTLYGNAGWLDDQRGVERQPWGVLHPQVPVTWGEGGVISLVVSLQEL